MFKSMNVGLRERKLYRTILLPKKITSELINKIISEVTILCSTSPDPLTILIDSDGGSLQAAFACRDILAWARKKNVVQTVVTGSAYSAGAYIAACGSKGHRWAFPRSELMIHALQTVTFGDYYRDHERERVRLDRFMRQYISSFAFECEKTETGEANDEDMKKKAEILTRLFQEGDSWIDTEEAKSLGIIDHIGVPDLIPSPHALQDEINNVISDEDAELSQEGEEEEDESSK